jgi:hypothetical protein
MADRAGDRRAGCTVVSGVVRETVAAGPAMGVTGAGRGVGGLARGDGSGRRDVGVVVHVYSRRALTGAVTWRDQLLLSALRITTGC